MIYGKIVLEVANVIQKVLTLKKERMKDMGWSKTADIRKYVDLGVMEKIMKEWSVATGMATIAMDAKGEYVSGEIGFVKLLVRN